MIKTLTLVLLICLPGCAGLRAAGVNATSDGAASSSAQTGAARKRRARRARGAKGRKVSETAKKESTMLQPGSWGGEHIRLDVREGGAEVEFDCAHGTLAGPLRLDGSGRFEAAGTHVREGGPVRLNVPRVGRPARYAGTVAGGEMTLTVTLTDKGQEVGTFTLTRGGEALLRKCR